MEVWFQDEAGFGQKGTLTRIWSGRGKRATALRPTGYEWTCLFGSVCPLSGMPHGLLLPHADLESMRVYLADFSQSLSAETHAILVCDQAGRHTSGRLAVPSNVTLLHLPPKSPELNPPELLWREMRQKHLGKRVFPDVDNMYDAVSAAWMHVIENPRSVQSLCGFEWITEIVK